MKKPYIITFLIGAVLAVATSISAQVTYVKADATGTNNGSSWQNAYTDLSAALASTTTGQVWVAAGKYLPGSNAPDPNDVFSIKSPISLYGGFAGTETSLSQRNPTANNTVLSGDLNDDNAPMAYDSILSVDNTLHVIYVDSLLNAPVLIDGFSIEHGVCDNDNTLPIYRLRGGGIFALSPIQVKNCVFSGNYARSGAGIYLATTCDGSLVRDCLFKGNEAGAQSAGIYAESVVGLDILQCEFKENFTQRGALYPLYCSNVLIDSCDFQSNINVNGFGGAIFAWGNENLILSNSNFEGNIAANAGAININGSEVPGSDAGNFIIDNCTFKNNEVTDFGGGAIWNSSTDCTIRNCDFSFNIGANGAHLFQNAPGAQIRVESCDFSDAQASGWGGAATCYGLGADIKFTDCSFLGNTVANLGGAANNGFGAVVTYENCSFKNNQSSSSAGGALALQNDSTTVIAINCEFESNAASSNGGAIFSGASESSSILVIDRCDFTANQTTGGVGGAVYIGEGGDDDISSLTLSNSIFGFNQSPTQGGAINLGDTDATITSCLFFQNIAEDIGTGAAISNNVTDSNTVEVNIVNCTFAQNFGTLASGIANWTSDVDAVSLTNVQNCIFWQEGGVNYAIEAGTPQLVSKGGNLSDDSSLAPYLIHPKDILLEEPSFVDPDDYDYHLTDNSVGVDDGVAEGAPTLDLEGNPRQQLVDMGAYENQNPVGAHERLLVNDGLLSLSPNPAFAASTNLALENEWQGEIRLSVTNVLGSVVWSARVQKTGKILNYALPLEFGRGLYQVQASNGSELVTERLVRL